MFRDLDARYVISIGMDDRPFSGKFLVAHNFAFDEEHLLCQHPHASAGRQPKARQHLRRRARRQLGRARDSRPGRHRAGGPPLPEAAGPAGRLARRRASAAQGLCRGTTCPKDYDDEREFPFDEPPEGCIVVPFGPFHPTLDEPAHFRLYVEGEMVRGCEYRGFMVHRGIEKLAESVLTYNDIPMMAERICGICGCVHNVAYAQAVESAAAIKPPPRAEYIRTIMLEIERLHSHLLWVGLACHILGFDTLFMQSFRIREPIMWIAEKISGNRKTYALCVIGGVRWDITPELADRAARACSTSSRAEWRPVVAAVSKDRNIQKRTRGVGVPTRPLVQGRRASIGPVARAAGVDIDCRRDHPYAAYDRVEFDVITERRRRRLVARPGAGAGGLRIDQDHPPVPGQDGARARSSSTSRTSCPWDGSACRRSRPRAARAHHFVITGENNRPRRWRVRAPTYQNLQGVPAMIKDQQLADMTISLGSIDPCFSCTDRLETIDLRSGATKVWTQEELLKLVRTKKT